MQSARSKFFGIEENFNYSRINNRAAEQLGHRLSAVHEQRCVRDRNRPGCVPWSTRRWPILMSAIVGIKLIYPNQTVQHAGVVLGVGGIADHTFRYAERNVRCRLLPSGRYVRRTCLP